MTSLRWSWLEARAPRQYAGALALRDETLASVIIFPSRALVQRVLALSSPFEARRCASLICAGGSALALRTSTPGLVSEPLNQMRSRQRRIAPASFCARVARPRATPSPQGSDADGFGVARPVRRPRALKPVENCRSASWRALCSLWRRTAVGSRHSSRGDRAGSALRSIFTLVI